MEDRKLEFFIGATKEDLRFARQEIIDSILEAGHIPSGMELWASAVDPLLEDIRRHIKRCDVHIIILGARYGCFINDKKRISFTDWEYVQSRKRRPIIAFLSDDHDFVRDRKRVLKMDPDEAGKDKDLKRFRDLLRKERFCRSFRNNPEGIRELGRLCVNSIHELINTRRVSNETGWLRASGEEAITLRQINENPFLKRELDRIRQFRVVGERVALDVAAKRSMGSEFWKVMKGRVRRFGYRNLFIESGSTLFYVSDEFEQQVLRNSGDVGDWCIKTNNVIALLQLLLYTDVDITRFPATVPDPSDKYGAIFPSEWGKIEESPPLRPRKLYHPEENAVKEMRAHFQSFGERTLILATTSCWDLDHPRLHFHGPHIGSHPNMLFKRALFTTGQPVVIFLNAEKLGDPFTIGKCYPVFGPDLPLDRAIKKYPLALCVGYDQNLSSRSNERIPREIRKERNKPERISSVLSELGFKVPYNTVKSTECGSIIAGNTKFSSLLPSS